MTYNLITAERDQLCLLPPSLSDWLPEDHLVHQVLEAVTCFDVEPFLQR